MKAEELRTGNFIEQGKVFEVKPYQVRVSYWHQHKQQDAMSLVKLDECDPIPLSEEVLLKCGFKRIANLISGSEIEIEYYQKGKIIVYLLKDFFEIEIETSSGIFNLHQTFEKHLHQLQNLYYALTGEELEVSL